MRCAGLRLTLGLGQRYEPYNLAVSLALEVVTEKDIGLMVSTTGRLLPCHMFLGWRYNPYSYTDVFLAHILPIHFLWMDLKSQVKWRTDPLLGCPMMILNHFFLFSCISLAHPAVARSPEIHCRLDWWLSSVNAASQMSLSFVVSLRFTSFHISSSPDSPHGYM